MSPSVSILVDTNVILDVLCAREPFADASEAVLNLCEDGVVCGRISALSIPNIVYIMRKELDAALVESVVDSLDIAVGIAELRPSDLKAAASMRWKDYEDAVQAATAKRLGADFIVTRNVKDFLYSPVPAIEPAEFLREIGGGRAFG